MFEYKTSVKLHETDAAGLLFFAHQFRIAHDAYEAFMASAGFDFGTVLREGRFVVPIVHASADFTSPLFVGDPLTVIVRVEAMTEHSFTLVYSLKGKEGSEVGRARTVHVLVDRASGEKVSLPEKLRAAFKRISG